MCLRTAPTAFLFLAMQTSTSPPELSSSPVCETSATDVSAAKPEKRRMRSKALDERPTCLQLQRPWSKQTMLDHADALAEASKAVHGATHAARAAVTKAGGDTSNLHSSPNLGESLGETTRLLPPSSLPSSQSMETAPSPAAVHSTTLEFLLGGGGAPQQQKQQRCSSLADAAARSSQTIMAAHASMTTKVLPTPPTDVRVMPLAPPTAQ